MLEPDAALQESVRQARRLADQAELLFSAAPAALLKVDPATGAIRAANPAALRCFGLSLPAALERTLRDLTPLEGQGQERLQRHQGAEQGSFGPVRQDCLRPDGTHFPARISGVRCPEADGSESLLITVEDCGPVGQVELDPFSQQIIRSAQEGIIVYGLDLSYRLWSPYMEILTGIPAASVLGRLPQDLFQHLRGQGIKEGLERVLAGEPAAAVEFPFSRPDGAGTVWARIVHAPFRNARGEIIGVIGTVSDITERHRSEVELLESRELFTKAFEISPDAIAITRLADGVYLAINQGFIQMTGYQRSELLGQSSIKLAGPLWVDPADRARMIDRLREHGQVTDLEARFRMRDGHLITGLISARILHTTGEAKLLSITRDITERLTAQAEQARLQAQLQQSQKLESLGSLAGGVAHDMNNVLGAILGLASAQASQEPEGSPARQAFSTIATAAVRGGSLVRGLLSFARQSPAERLRLDANALLREQAQLLEHTTLARINLKLDLDPELRPIRGDAGALGHTIMNLCVNALDAMADGGSLTLASRNHEPGWIELSVTDTGQGMPRDVLDRAMDPFFTTKAMGKGTGLGLSMAFSTVKAHEGRIELHSEPGRGTRVSLRLPACEPADAPVTPGSRAASGTAGLSVLLIDDDDLIQYSMEALLKVLGHRIHTVTCGEEGLAALAAGLRPDLVILDMNMPGLGGAGTLPLLRASHPHLPVLLATGRADQAAMDLVDAHPGVTLLAKPFSLEELKAHLGALRRG